jgi:hypothetical protein
MSWGFRARNARGEHRAHSVSLGRLTLYRLSYSRRQIKGLPAEVNTSPASAPAVDRTPHSATGIRRYQTPLTTIRAPQACTAGGNSLRTSVQLCNQIDLIQLCPMWLAVRILSKFWACAP